MTDSEKLAIALDLLRPVYTADLSRGWHTCRVCHHGWPGEAAQIVHRDGCGYARITGAATSPARRVA